VLPLLVFSIFFFVGVFLIPCWNRLPFTLFRAVDPPVLALSPPFSFTRAFRHDLFHFRATLRRPIRRYFFPPFLGISPFQSGFPADDGEFFWKSSGPFLTLPPLVTSLGSPTPSIALSSSPRASFTAPLFSPHENPFPQAGFPTPSWTLFSFLLNGPFWVSKDCGDLPCSCF